MIKLSECFFHVVGPDKFNEAFRNYRGLIFPEERYDQIAYIKKARRMFEKLRDINLWAAPLNLKGKRDERK